MTRCKAVKGKPKIKFHDAGEAALYVQPGEHRGIYLCAHCGFYHLTRERQKRGATVLL